MKKEIERKFLVADPVWREAAGEGVLCEQGYLASAAGGPTVRVRRMGGIGYLTVKGPTEGISRVEMEYDIPEADAAEMIETLCGDCVVSKKRYRIEFGGFIWEVDEFFGANEGLVLAEIELPSEDQVFDKPCWVGDEVSHEACYFNALLAKNPFCDWDV